MAAIRKTGQVSFGFLKFVYFLLAVIQLNSQHHLTEFCHAKGFISRAALQALGIDRLQF